MATGFERTKQCAACPWRKDCDPDRDIPGGYSRDKHVALRRTLEPDGPLMACHETPVGRDQACVGWIKFQLEQGHNLKPRLAVVSGLFDPRKLEVFGEQHQSFEDTLPRRRRRRG